MRMCVRCILPGLLVALLPNLWFFPAVWAQRADSPLFLPTADVTVTYQVVGIAANGPRKMQIIYAKAGERVRIDYFRWIEAKYPYLAVIFDRPANRLISVQPERKAYIDREISGNNNPGMLLPPNMQFTRQGQSVVAHGPCTVWSIAVPNRPDDDGTACVTDDGIVLRLASTKPTVTSLTATAIHYGEPPDGTFDPPKGFKRETEP